MVKVNDKIDWSSDVNEEALESLQSILLLDGADIRQMLATINSRDCEEKVTLTQLLDATI